MPLPMQEVLSVLAMLADNEQIKVNVKEYVKGGIIAGSCTAVGGALGGPVGMAVGGAIGGGLAGWLASGKCVPLSTVIRDMSDANKQQLYTAAMACVTKFDISDIATLKMLVLGAGAPQLSNMLITALRDFAARNYELAA